jgi:hypothetical protein
LLQAIIWLATIIYLKSVLSCPIVLSCPLLRAVTISCRPIRRRPTDHGNKPKLITVFKFSRDLSLFTCNYAMAMAIYINFTLLACCFSSFRYKL